MQKFRVLLLTASFALMAFSQEAGRNTITLGVGGGFPSGGTGIWGIPDSAAFSASYEFRLLKYLSPEVAVVNTIPNVNYGGEYGPVISRERITLLSFGPRGVAPLMHGRMELFAGVGAAHLWSTDLELTVLGYEAPRWFVQLSGGGRIAIDRRHRFWIGPTVRFTRDGARPTEEWVALTGDVGFRF
jgi:hypothetical protein